MSCASCGNALALVASVLVAIVPAAAQDGGERAARSPLEEPDPVLHVRLSLTGSDMLDAVTALGVDIGHDLRRVPTGIEVDATVRAELVPELQALGVDLLPPGAGWQWDLTATQVPATQNLLRAGSTFGALGFILTHESTVRIARADWFTTKGHGFLYVEARTTEGQQTSPIVTMQLANDSGAGTPFGAQRAMSRFVDSGQYMFHRKPLQAGRAAEPDPGRQLDRTCRHGLRLRLAGRRRPADGGPELQVELRQRLQAPATSRRSSASPVRRST